MTAFRHLFDAPESAVTTLEPDSALRDAAAFEAPKLSITERVIDLVKDDPRAVVYTFGEAEAALHLPTGAIQLNRPIAPSVPTLTTPVAPPPTPATIAPPIAQPIAQPTAQPPQAVHVPSTAPTPNATPNATPTPRVLTPPSAALGLASHLDQDRYAHDPSDPMLREIIALYDACEPLALVGPHGCGKSLLARELARSRGQETIVVVGHGQKDWDDLIGRYVHTGNPDQPTAFLDGPVTAALRKPNCTLIIDELAAMPIEVLQGLNELLNEGVLVNDRKAGGETLRIPAGFRIIATFNPWSEYEGNNALSLAFLGRFHLLSTDYPVDSGPGPLPEVALLQRRGLEAQDAATLVHFASQTREVHRKKHTRFVVATRTLLTIARRMSLGSSLYEAAVRTIEPLVTLIAPEEVDSTMETLRNTIAES